MDENEFNLGIWIGGAAAIISIFAALTALYLWAVNRARQRLDQTATPQERAVIPWLSPLVLPVLVILCLGLVAHLAKAYQQKSWPEASYIFITVMILIFWLKIRKKTRTAHRNIKK